MSNLKKLLAVIVTVCLLATMTIPAFAAASDAEICEKLSILKGEGAGVTEEYLAKGTNRFQAALLYLRLIGLEDEALAFTGEDNFEDAGLIYKGGQRVLAYLKAKPELGWLGIGGNKFDPTGAASAQMIYKVMLEALGYKQGEDFEWAEVKDFAAEIGLSKIADVTELTNADMATAIVEALKCKVKDSDKTLIEKLVEDGIVDEAVAEEVGLIDGYKPLDVENVSAIANTKVEISLKTAAKKVDASKMSIKDEAGAALEIKSVALKDEKTVRIVTAAQTANALYTITIDGKDYKFVGLAADTDKPQLVSAVALDNTTVKVTFNEPVENIENVANYTIEGLSVLKAEYGYDVNGNLDKTIVILTTSSQTSGTIYKLVVTGVTDIEGNVIDADHDEFQFGGLPADTTKPRLVSAVAITNTKVDVTFDEDMDKESVENIANYSIEGLTILKAEQKNDKKVVRLTTSSQTSGTIYKLVVSGVKDKYGNVIDSDNDEFQFGGLAPDTTAPRLLSAVALSNTSVVVTFDEAMDKASVENIANYSIEGLTILKAEQDKDNAAIVKLTTSAQTAGTIYKLIVANVTDESGNKIDSDYDEFQFGGLDADTTKPALVSATALSNTSVRVVFSEPMDETLAKQPYRYYFGSELGYATKVEKATSPNDGTTWIVTTKAQAQKVYKLTVSGVTDLSGNVIDPDRDEVEFAGTAVGDTTPPKVVGATAVDNKTIIVTFDEPVNGVDKSDFVFSVSSGTETQPDGKKLAGKTAGENDGIKVSDDRKTVTLQFATVTQTPGVIYKVTVPAGAVTNDARKTIADANNYALFAGQSNDNPDPKVAAAQLVNNQTLKIIFSEPVSVVGSIVGADFTIEGFTGVFVKAVMASDGKSVTVYYQDDANPATSTDKFAAGTVYSVTVNKDRFKDGLGVANMTDANNGNKASFAGIPNAAGTPKISSIIAVDQNTIDITFDQPVNSTLSTGDITVKSSTGAAMSVTIKLVRPEGNDGNKLRVFFDGTPFTAGQIYTVALSEAKITNNNGYTMAASDNNKVFAAISTPNPAPKMVVATKIGDKKIEVKFSEIVTNVNATDFVIEGTSVAVSTAEIDSNDKTKVRLTLSGSLVSGQVYTLKLANNHSIKDEAGVAKADSSVSVKFAY